MAQKRRQLFRLFLKHDFETSPKLTLLAAEARQLELPVELRNVNELNRLTDVDRFNNFRPHQGVCLDCRCAVCIPLQDPLPTTSVSTYGDFLNAASLSSQWLFPVLVDVKDPMNLGAILRSASFFGVDQLLVLGEGGMKRVSPVVSKASSGAAESARIFRLEDGLGFFQEAREMGDTILGTSVPVDDNEEGYIQEEENSRQMETAVSQKHLFGTESRTSESNAPSKTPMLTPLGVHLYDAVSGALLPCDGLRRRSPTFLLFGNEGAGLHPDLLRLCHHHVRINNQFVLPVAGSGSVRRNNVDSLNVSVAAGILLHHLLCSPV